MKNLLVIVLLLLSVNVFGQKYGHCDVNVIAGKLPELIEIEKQVQTKTAELEGRLQRMYEVYQKKIGEFQTSVSTMTADQQKIAAEEIQNLEVRIQEAQQNSQMELQQYDMDLKKPLFDRVKKAIDDVSTENGFSLVFDVSGGTVLYAGGEDVNALVLQKLGVQ
jgi:outer membrane protein